MKKREKDDDVTIVGFALRDVKKGDLVFLDDLCQYGTTSCGYVRDYMTRKRRAKKGRRR